MPFRRPDRPMTTWSDDRACALNSVRLWLDERDRHSGEDRAEVRAQLRHAIWYWRKFHQAPDAAAFEAAVDRSKRPTQEAA